MSQSRSPKRSLPEIITLVASGIVVAVLVGALVVLQVGGADEPASFEVSFDAGGARAAAGAHYLELQVRNLGGRGAERVVVEVIQQVGDRPVVSEFVLETLAGHARERIVAVLREDPRRSPVRAEVRSYIRP